MCDPWIGWANENAWLSFPYDEEGPEIVRKLAPTAVYISHLHPDHHDPKTLEHIDRATPILIKTFRDSRLAGKLKAQGFTSIIELDGWAVHKLGDDLEVAIVPASNMVNREIDAAISYDIDTSLLVHDTKTGQVFYNNVDNPMSIDALKGVRAFAEKTWGRAVDIACLPVGAASEYPHCFMGIDRWAAARRIIGASLKELPVKIDALGCTNLFIAGGTYVICGKFSALNSFIAQPGFDEIKAFLSSWTSSGHGLFSLEGGGTLSFEDDNAWTEVAPENRKTADKAAYARAASALDYDYPSDVRTGKMDVTKAKTRARAALNGAMENYRTILGKIGLKQDWTTEFSVYADLRVADDGNIAAGSAPAWHFTLPAQGKTVRQTLKVHLDLDLFIDLLEGHSNWNGALSGSYILYEREPDFFLPDAPFSLNFLVDRSGAHD